MMKGGKPDHVTTAAQIFSFVVEILGEVPMVCEVKVLLARALLMLGDEAKATEVLEEGTTQVMDMSQAYSEQGSEGLEQALNMSTSYSKLIMTLFGVSGEVRDHRLPASQNTRCH